MNLLYIWNSDYAADLSSKGYLLNSKYNIQFSKSKILHIGQNSDYMEGFWGKHIFDTIAVVGKNGTGKTKLANCIMDTLGQFVTKWPDELSPYVPQLIVVFEDIIEGKNIIKICVTNQFMNISVNTVLDYEIYPISEFRKIEEFKFGYFNNILDMNDYRNERYGVVFDASVGGSINKNFKHDLEMHYIDNKKDKILNYYEDEVVKILDFITSDLNNTKIPFTLPQYIRITIADYKVNLRYISKELDKMNKRVSDFYFFDRDPKDILSGFCQNIIKNENSWNSHLVVNLILNLFKDLCIPQTSADHLEREAEEFLRILSQMETLYFDNIFKLLLQLLDRIEHTLYYKDQLCFYKNLLYWLLETSAFLENKEMVSRNACHLNLTEDIGIIKKLLYFYKNTNAAYPYLSFDFGLSTGEFNFLKLFSKIAELTHRDANGRCYIVNNITRKVKCKNVFLFFDEVDLSLHPEWQRQYVDWLLQFINTYFESCTVQILITTHSPIMLSDFPDNNVFYLWKEGEKCYAEKKDIKTFGSNIHTLFMDSFFLNDNGTMGAYAEKKINAIARDLKKGRIIESKNVLKIIDSIGDDILRNKLRQMYNVETSIEKKMRQEKPDETIINSTIDLIKNQIKNLQNTLDELERMKNDKD